jgi:hypothetical protein
MTKVLTVEVRKDGKVLDILCFETSAVEDLLVDGLGFGM